LRTIERQRIACSWIVFTMSRASAESGVTSSSSLNPTMAVSGLLISCVTPDTRLPSARSLSARASSCWSCSLSLRAASAERAMSCISATTIAEPSNTCTSRSRKPLNAASTARGSVLSGQAAEVEDGENAIPYPIQVRASTSRMIAVRREPRLLRSARTRSSVIPAAAAPAIITGACKATTRSSPRAESAVASAAPASTAASSQPARPKPRLCAKRQAPANRKPANANLPDW
jgi:hypothetical protein